MKIIIETYRRDEGYLALAVKEGAPLYEGAVAGGPDEIDAAHDALDEFLKAEAQRTSAPRTREVQRDLLAGTPAYAEALAEVNPGEANVVVVDEPHAIRRILQNLAGSHSTRRIVLKYSDSLDRPSTRTITVTDVEERRRAFGFHEGYLIAQDVEKDEPRTFLLARIQSITVPGDLV